MNDATLEEFEGEADHVYLLVLYPPIIVLSVLVNSLKGGVKQKIKTKF
jgi:putative transposase